MQQPIVYFGKRLKQLREENSLTQQDLSDLLHVGRSTIAGYETKGKEPDFQKLCLLANYFNVSIDYLLGLSNERKQTLKVSLSSDSFLPERLIGLLSEDEDFDLSFYAKLAHIPLDIFQQYVMGEKAPTAYDLCKIIEVFDTSADYLFGKTDVTHNSHNMFYESVLAQIIAHEMDGNYLEAEVAEKLEIPISDIKALLSGEQFPDSSLLYSMAQLFRKSTDYLLGISEHSRMQDIDGNYPFFFDKEISARIYKLMDSRGDSSYWADFLSISEEEIVMFKKYGFLIHVSVLSKLADMLNVSIDYLTGRTDAQKTLMQSEESLLLAFRNLNDENRSIAYGEVLKLKKDQEREEYLRSTPSVAAEDVRRGTGTDGLGK